MAAVASVEAEASSALAAPAAPATADNDDEPPDELICPITQEVMEDPVVAADGHTYERAAIARWMVKRMTSPKTGEDLESPIVFPNHSVRRMVREWQESMQESRPPATVPYM